MESLQRKDKKIKICYIVTLPITIRSFFIPQLKYLSENGFDVSVVCAKDESLQEELGHEIAYYPIEIPRGISVLGSIKATSQLIHFFRKEQFDIIQYSTPNAAMCASVAGRITNINVRNYHVMGFRYLGARGLLKYILKKIEKISCKNATHIECVSKSNLEIGVKEKLFERDKAVVVWNGSSGGVDLERFDFRKRAEYREEIRKKYGFLERDFIFGFVGRITRDKGVNELLDAFSKIENAKLFMVGEVEGASTLERQLYRASLANPNIVYTGQVSDVERYFSAIDILVLPSYREGFGNVVIEAAAIGTPAIVSNIPGPVDAVKEKETALIVKTKSTESLLKAMKQAQTMDYIEMGQKAEQFARENFDSVVLCRKILERKVEINGCSNIVKRRTHRKSGDSALQ